MGVLRKEVSTSLNNRNYRLKTRFYRNNLKEIKDAFEKICFEENKSLRQADESEGKMYISTQEYEVFIKVLSESSVESSVDLSVHYFVSSMFKNPKRIIYNLYKKLDNLLIFKGTVNTV